MKNLIIALASVLALTFSNDLLAQPINKNNTETADKTMNDGEEVAILTNFKATKSQKKVIKKVKKYVSPRILGNYKNSDALRGKTVTVQLSLNENGKISNLQMVRGFEESIDARVLDFIREYDAKKPFADSKLDQPAVIQMEIPLVGKRQYMN